MVVHVARMGEIRILVCKPEETTWENKA